MRYIKFGLLHFTQLAREVLFMVFIAFTYNAYSQYNLVPNGDFEIVLDCNNGSISSAENWNSPTLVGTPDLISLCNPIWINFISEYQQPNSGLSYVGLATAAQGSSIDSNFREYIQVKLKDTLIINKIYKIEYYLSLLECGAFATNNFGLYFSSLPISNSVTNFSNSQLNFVPQVKSFNNIVITDTADFSWYKVSAIFISSGSELYLTCGNFNTDFETIILNFNNQTNLSAYYGIDDISVVPLDSIPGGLPANAGPDQTIYIQDSVFIGQRIANLNCNWYELGGSQIASNTSGLYVQPLQTTTYVVEQILGDDISYDTCTVFVEGLGLNENVLMSFKLYPNPSNGALILQSSQQINSPCSITITDLLGKVVYQANAVFNAGQLKLETDLSDGSYLLSVSNEKIQLLKERLIVIK